MHIKHSVKPSLVFSSLVPGDVYTIVGGHVYWLVCTKGRVVDLATGHMMTVADHVGLNAELVNGVYYVEG
ncbi:hypothetical protein [Pectobacterium phage Peat1]|uniref:Uncharacterized protein n=1 Tax=Pectobacterium phage Peat1 TaxID=1654601 RepID=A0A0H3YEN2_9CAUD|nr:hypothetical protein AXI77_gp14 [Pectobacterium phage Peat1]AKN21171.1 hypothetical protein [Pectobacterium phage Peat1]